MGAYLERRWCRWIASELRGRPAPKLITEQFAELCDILEDGQRWASQAIHDLIQDRYGVTYDPAHLSRKLRATGMQ